MMKNELLMAALIVGISLSACSSMGGERKIGESWQGEPIDAVVQRWGIPPGSMQLSDGSTLYEWGNSSSYTMPGHSYGNVSVIGNTATFQTTTQPAIVMNGQCTRSLTADASGRIVSWAARGNDCCWAAIAGYCKSLMNPNR